MSSENCYPIEGTSNRHGEQKSGPYLDPTWWDTWEEDIEKFIVRKITKRELFCSYMRDWCAHHFC